MIQIIVNRAKQSLDANAAIKDKAKKLRKKKTEAEKILWSKIRNREVNGMYFRRQHPYGIYILDFFCFEANLVIEVDGLIHFCLLYTSDAADDLTRVDLGGRRIIKKK